MALIDRIDRAIDAVGRAAAWLNLGMAAAICVVVALRYAFDIGAIFLQESVVYLHGAAFLLGLSYALQHDAHVRVDMLYARFGSRLKALIDILGHVLFLMPLCLTVAIVGTRYAMRSWAVLEGSPEVGGVPAIFLLKTLIPISAALLFAQAAALGARAFRRLRAHG